ncbi:MAG: FkbM family methyltransferase [Nostoc sp.]|uniref:FkbM family methyltransferase n=1 Tax=Nostoc sp. TaxID=1180 RepID=UPI002FF989D7
MKLLTDVRSLLREWLPYRLIKYREDRRRYMGWGLSFAQSSELARLSPSRCELEETGWYLLPAEMLSHIHTIVDVGAHRGNWSAAMLKYANPKQIVAFEPLPELFVELQSRFASEARIDLRPKAIGEEISSITINVTEHKSACSILCPDSQMNNHYGYGWSIVDTVEVKISTLDEELHNFETIDLIKIDVQGYEKSVLSGAKQTLKKVQALMIEQNLIRHYKEDLLFWELHKLLEDTYGFKLYNISDPFRSISGRSLWFDAIYLSSDSKFC